MVAWIGLGMFVLMILIGFITLIYDLWLVIVGKRTISEWVIKRPGRKWVLFGLVALGALGLLLHFVAFAGGY